MAASTLWCPNCGAKNQLMIAGMAQNGTGFEWKRDDTTNNSIPEGIKEYSNVTDINWEKYFKENSDKANNPWRAYRAQDYGGDFDLKYQLALFIVNMQALRKEGWRLPPGIRDGDLIDIHNQIRD